MHARVRKWGNSLALRIPKALADEAGIEKDSAVELALEDGRLVVARKTPRRYTLKRLLAGVTPRNRRREVDTGPSVGGEAW